MYTYNATVVKHIDGDTIDLILDLGFYINHRLRVRLARINTPELKGDTLDAGLAALNYLRELLPVNSTCTISTAKTDKYGRWIGEICVGNQCINNLMVEAGHAVMVEY